MQGCDGRGLGWFSLFVAVTVAPMAILEFAQADGFMSVWLSASWAAWAGLWFLNFVLLTLQKPVVRQAAWATLICGVLTAWLPGMLILYGGAT